MQIFSKLQRNSTYYSFIKFLIYTIVLALNTQSLLAPLLIGFVIYCENIVVASLYISIFSILHLYPIFYLFLILIVFKFFLYQKIVDYIDKQYQEFVAIFLIYMLFSFGFEFSKIILIYLLFNFTFDSFLAKVFKCEHL
jgi:hypothetical protein